MRNLLKRDQPWAGIGWGGLIAGTLDILVAFVLSGMRQVGPDRVLHYIASGLLGTRAYLGGWTAGALGLLLHFVIAFGAAAVYWLLSRVARIMVTQPVLCGLLYGIPVYLFMNFVILPLSKIAARPVGPSSGIVVGVVVIMIFVGLPIAVMTSRFSR